MWLIWGAIGVFCKKVNRVVPLLAFLWALRACLCSNINTLGLAGGQPPASRGPKADARGRGPGAQAPRRGAKRWVMGSQVARRPHPSLKSQGLSNATVPSLSSSREACVRAVGRTVLGEGRARGRGARRRCWDPVKARSLASLAECAEGTRANPAPGQWAPRKGCVHRRETQGWGTQSISCLAFATRKPSCAPEPKAWSCLWKEATGDKPS